MFSDRGNVRGFYYDHQINDPLYTIQLFPNTKLKLNEDKTKAEWVPANGNPPDPNSNQDWSGCYSTTPIASAICSEDFQIEIGNQWTDYEGGNPIEGAFNSMKPYAPYLSTLGKAFQSATESFMSDEDIKNSKVARAVNSIAHLVGSGMASASKYLNKGLIIQGTRFAYYTGTVTRFGNLGLKYTIFPDWVPDPKDPKKMIFQSVNDHIAKISPYVMGAYTPWNLKVDGIENKYAKDLVDSGLDMISEYVGWQNPPAGFEAGLKSLDTTLKGTIRLVMAGYYKIDNLVISDMNVVMSRTMTKDPTDPSKPTPLYAEITLQLKPATLYTDRALAKFIRNAAMEDIMSTARKAGDTDLTLSKDQIKSLTDKIGGSGGTGDYGDGTPEANKSTGGLAPEERKKLNGNETIVYDNSHKVTGKTGKFKESDDKGCANRAQEIVVATGGGYHPDKSETTRIAVVNPLESNKRRPGTAKHDEMSKMMSYIDSELAAGRAVAIMVDYNRSGGQITVNQDGMADHWIAITGKTADGKYMFLDPASAQDHKFKSKYNVLSVDPDGRLTGNRYDGTVYVVTSYAPNVIRN